MEVFGGDGREDEEEEAEVSGEGGEGEGRVVNKVTDMGGDGLWGVTIVLFDKVDCTWGKVTTVD